VKILKYPDPRLTARNEAVGAWSSEVASKVEEMRKAMAEADGVGLAAPQIGWNVRLFILGIPNRISGEFEEGVIFDPALEMLGEKRVVSEGCLSFPGLPGRVPRHTRVRLTGKTPEGDLDEILEGLEAQAAQHEMDHLDSILFIDRMTAADRRVAEINIRALESEWKTGGP
jgi:peptide deformylase